jgi:hypothetical protein
VVERPRQVVRADPTSPLSPRIPRLFLTRFLKDNDQCQCDAPERRADVRCFPFLATAVTMGKGLDWQAGQFLVSGWNILFSTKLDLATLAGRESFK